MIISPQPKKKKTTSPKWCAPRQIISSYTHFMLLWLSSGFCGGHCRAVLERLISTGKANLAAPAAEAPETGSWPGFLLTTLAGRTPEATLPNYNPHRNCGMHFSDDRKMCSLHHARSPQHTATCARCASHFARVIFQSSSGP
uniref:(northern house mosquito) hypothetical protein n=2 Tax=Culex pipiens TaxID=7175 RepID=A0A8D8BFW9_CULPI